MQEQQNPSDFQNYLPNAEYPLNSDTEDLAGWLLEWLHTRPCSRDIAKWSIINGNGNDAIICPTSHRDRQIQAVTEAFCWLIRQGLVVPAPGTGKFDEFVLSRQGQKIKNKRDLEAYRERLKYPKELLHPTICSESWDLYVRGNYETAVFAAFREVEVATRTAGNYGNDVIGVDLMRRAFNAQNGPLIDKSEPSAEREALSHLFAGAMGRFRNSAGHRHVGLTDPREAFQLLVFASYLLSVIDVRAPRDPAATDATGEVSGMNC